MVLSKGEDAHKQACLKTQELSLLFSLRKVGVWALV